MLVKGVFFAWSCELRHCRLIRRSSCPHSSIVLLAPGRGWIVQFFSHEKTSRMGKDKQRRGLWQRERVIERWSVKLMERECAVSTWEVFAYTCCFSCFSRLGLQTNAMKERPGNECLTFCSTSILNRGQEETGEALHAFNCSSFWFVSLNLLFWFFSVTVQKWCVRDWWGWR